MKIQIREAGHAWVLSVSGKLDAVSALDYSKTIGQLITDGKTRFVVDFAELSYISSAGLRALLSTVKQLKSVGGFVRFANLQGNVQEVFEMTGFLSIMDLHTSVDAALAGM